MPIEWRTKGRGASARRVRARLPLAGSSSEAGGTGSADSEDGREPAGALGSPRPPPTPADWKSPQSSSQSCHVAFAEDTSDLTLPRQRHPRPKSPLGEPYERHSPKGWREPDPREMRSRHGRGAAASPCHLPSRGCGAARSAEARLPVATTRRRFAAKAAAASAAAAASYISVSSIRNPGGCPR